MLRRNREAYITGSYSGYLRMWDYQGHSLSIAKFCVFKLFLCWAHIYFDYKKSSSIIFFKDKIGKSSTNDK